MKITITHIDCSKSIISCESYKFVDNSYIIEDLEKNIKYIIPERNILVMKVEDEEYYEMERRISGE